MDLFFLALGRKNVPGNAQAHDKMMALCTVQVHGMVLVCGMDQVCDMGQVHGKNWVHGNHEV